jgi:hypothetical protein
MNDEGESMSIVNLKDFRAQKRKEKIDKYWEQTRNTVDSMSLLAGEQKLLLRVSKMEEAIQRMQQFLLAHDDELELTQESIKNIKNVIVQMHKKLDA